MKSTFRNHYAPLSKTSFILYCFINHLLLLFCSYVPNVKDLVHVTAIESAAYGPDYTWRALCVIPSSKYVGSKHKAKEIAVDVVVQELLKDKNGVLLERNTDFGLMDIGGEKNLLVEITNMNSDAKTIVDASFRNANSNFELISTDFPVLIPGHDNVFLELSFK